MLLKGRADRELRFELRLLGVPKGEALEAAAGEDLLWAYRLFKEGLDLVGGGRLGPALAL